MGVAHFHDALFHLAPHGEVTRHTPSFHAAPRLVKAGLRQAPPGVSRFMSPVFMRPDRLAGPLRVSRTSRWTTLGLSILLLLQSLLVPAFADIGTLPDLGDESATVISPQQEQQLGSDFLRRARGVLKIVDDPELNQYIQQLGERLVAHSGGPNHDFHFYIIQDPTLNAFAVPGGYVFVHTGLILAARNESELAAVLAHEIAHIQQRHIPRMMADSKRTTLPAMAALIAALVLGAQAGGQGSEAAIAATTAGLTQHELNFSREFEQEADNIGIRTLAAAGFDPRGMPAFFERLQSWARLNESSLPEFLRTHPVTATRITESRDRADRYPVPKATDQSAFFEARAKIRALTGDPAEAAKILRAAAADNKPYADAERYGLVWALLRNNQTDAARKEIDALLKRHPYDPNFLIAQAETEMTARHYEAGLRLYAAAHKRYPNAYAIASRYATALLETGHAGEAREQLRTMVRTHADDPVLYKMLARAAGDTGRLVEAHQALAEHYYLNGNVSAALEQLHLASRFAKGNFYEQSSIEARIKEIKDQSAWTSSR